jgi:orotate phosphoribosyltransferase-like protein
MAELALEIEELLEQGMTAKFIAVKLNVSIEMVNTIIEQLECYHIEKQYEMMSYADESADNDAQYYGA